MIFFYDAICNGLSLLPSYGLELNYESKQYAKSRKKLKDPCFEDVLIQMLKDGYKLDILDIEGEGEHNSSIGIEDVYERVQNTPLNHLCDQINEDGDCYTADAIIQSVFFKDLVFA